MLMGIFLIAEAAVSVFVTLYTVRVRSRRKRHEWDVLRRHEEETKK